MHGSAQQWKAVLGSAQHCTAVPCSTLQCTTLHGSASKCTAVHTSAQQCTAMLGSAEQCMGGTIIGGAPNPGGGRVHLAQGIHHLSNYFNPPSNSPFPCSWTKVSLVLLILGTLMDCAQAEKNSLNLVFLVNSG